LSYQASCCLHFGQIERPLTMDILLSMRYSSALIKLPTARPKRNIKSNIIAYNIKYNYRGFLRIKKERYTRS
jgi:hypothetical protein